MYISVVIPVYNAEKYVTQAVESALSQPETGEVILVEDNSPDNALQVCQELTNRYSKVRLLRHPNGENCGAGASRNLGIKNARFDYIAFLDADDFYLPGRFIVAKKLLDLHSDIDGIYEAIGTHFQDIEGKQKWFKNRGNNFNTENFLTTVTEVIEPELLFESLLHQRTGRFHTNGIVVRKSIFERTEYFNEKLELSQDTDMWLKMAAIGKLQPGRLTQAVGIRRVHSQNRVSESKEKLYYYRSLIIKNILDWVYKKKVSLKKLNVILDLYLYEKLNFDSQEKLLQLNWQNTKIMFDLVCRYPRFFFLKSFWNSVKVIVMVYLVPVKRIILNFVKRISYSS